nr:uncharacterized protein LOC131275036 [Dasypus novemcinctus]
MKSHRYTEKATKTELRLQKLKSVNLKTEKPQRSPETEDNKVQRRQRLRSEEPSLRLAMWQKSRITCSRLSRKRLLLSTLIWTFPPALDFSMCYMLKIYYATHFDYDEMMKESNVYFACLLRLLSRARPVTDQQSLRSARSSPNPRAQVDSAGPRPALSARPTPPRRPGESPVPAAGAGAERVQNHRHPGAGIYLGESAFESKGRPRPLWRETIIRAGRGGGYGFSSVSSVRGTCRAGGRPAEKTNRCFFFLLLLLPHRNTHKHPTRGPSYRGGIAAGPRTNPSVGGGVPPCGLVVSGESVPTEGGGEGGGGRSPVCVSLSFRLSLSEQNADRKCSCRNDSLRRRQTLTTTPSSPLHFRHRRRRRHFSSRPPALRPRPRPRRAPPHTTAGLGRGQQRGGGGAFSAPFSGRTWMLHLLSILRNGVFAAARAGRLSWSLFSCRRPERGPSSVVVLCLGGSQVRLGLQAAVVGGWRPHSLPRLVISFREPSSRRPRRGRPRFDRRRCIFKMVSQQPCGWMYRTPSLLL